MEIKSNINSRPFTPVSPGSILKDELEARSLPVEVFAEKIGLDKLTLEELLKGKLILSSENAKIARFLFSLKLWAFLLLFGFPCSLPTKRI